MWSLLVSTSSSRMVDTLYGYENDVLSKTSAADGAAMAPLDHLLLSLSNNKTNNNEQQSKQSQTQTQPSLLPVVDFERQQGVVVVTKIHDELYVDMLAQQYCLFTKAYNERMQYDLVLFTTVDLSSAHVKRLQQAVHPANLTIYNDVGHAKTVAEYLETTTAMSSVANEDDGRRSKNETTQSTRLASTTNNLCQRCKVNSTDQLTWRTRCVEPEHLGGVPMPIAYTWQCEFRAKWLWTHPGLAKYKYMMWMDSDTMCSKVWKQDPIAAMVRNDLVLMYDNFPQGFARGWRIQDRIQRAFNKTLCSITTVDGHFEAQYGNCWADTAIGGVHGMFHITSLDFFRSPPVQKWVNTLIGDGIFSRMFDDQIAVAVAPAILAPNRSWDMWSHGINLTVFHNGFLDGKKKWVGGFFKNYWKRMGATAFPEAHGNCTITSGGR